MADFNPELQARLDELERDLEVRSLKLDRPWPTSPMALANFPTTLLTQGA